ncbi:hypothetical protein [Hyphomicrobium sp. MC1]|uniref:hypothetical protein n=1 Tax=Hyphomicrobium sp. (strain MC1) TaxID=717785 RepID=UPI00059BCA7E|nr:hypothetical protein [Hyphomicrobium sp. MC1]
MSLRRPSCMAASALLLAASLSGCAGNTPELPSLGAQSTAATAPTPVTMPTSPTTAPGDPEAPPGTPIRGAVGSATTIYSHIATGAMACWFSVNGPLKKDYIFHAAADAPSRGTGGKAVITIHVRDPSQANPRGLKAYLVEIEPTGEETASVTVENRKMSDAYAAAMTDDISRWSKGEEGCHGPTTVAAWPPPPGDAVASATKPAKTAKKPKTKVKAAQAKPAAQSASQP